MSDYKTLKDIAEGIGSIDSLRDLISTDKEFEYSGSTVDGDYEKLIAIAKKGVSGTGALLRDMIERAGPDSNVTLEPGDRIITDEDGSSLLQVVSPIAYDLWYLRHFRNLTDDGSRPTVGEFEEAPAEDITQTYISQSYLDNQLSFLAEHLGGLKPLKVIADMDDLVRTEGDYWVATGLEDRWTSYGKWFINQMVFEMWAHKAGEQIPSAGASVKHGFKRNEVVGYLGFPMGQLGVIEVIALMSETMFEKADFELTDNIKPNTETVSERFFPPVDDYTGQNICMGDHLFESAYLVVDEKRRNVEYPVTPFPDMPSQSCPDINYPDIRPMMWMRYWIHHDETFPTPGEFIGLVCKPLALPPHIWWFQETSPLLFAGNWFETEYLTGGLIVLVFTEDQREILEEGYGRDGVGNFYVVKIQGYTLLVDGSDFWEYWIGDRVGIVKVGWVDVTKPKSKKSFTFADQLRITENEVNIFVNSSPGDPPEDETESAKQVRLADEQVDLKAEFDAAAVETGEELDEDPELSSWKINPDYVILPLEFYKNEE